MKLLVAYFRPHCLNQLKEALYAQDVKRFTVLDVFGHSEEDGLWETYRGNEIQVDLLRKLKLEVALNAHQVRPVIDLIRKVCYSGESGDGKILVLPIEEVYSIGSDAKNNEALS